jgi:hypothetical protein
MDLAQSFGDIAPITSTTFSPKSAHQPLCVGRIHAPNHAGREVTFDSRQLGPAVMDAEASFENLAAMTRIMGAVAIVAALVGVQIFLLHF